MNTHRGTNTKVDKQRKGGRTHTVGLKQTCGQTHIVRKKEKQVDHQTQQAHEHMRVDEQTQVVEDKHVNYNTHRWTNTHRWKNTHRRMNTHMVDEQTGGRTDRWMNAQVDCLLLSSVEYWIKKITKSHPTSQ